MSKLITTYNSNTWETEDVFYSGKWSVPFENENKIQKQNILDYHWSDVSKLSKDYLYLRKVHKDCLENFTKILNDYHKLNFSIKSWSLILSPWLMSIITIIFDKYETISFSLKKNKNYKTKVLSYSSKDFIPYNWLDYVQNKTTNDNWHHIIFSDLITKIFEKDFSVEVIDKKFSTSNKIYNFKLSLNDKIKNFLSFNFFLKKSNVFLDSSHISFFDYLKIIFNSNNKPYWISAFSESLNLQINPINSDLRYNLTKNFKLDDQKNFEKYLSQNIFNFIPMSYLENFKSYQEKVSKFKFEGNKIISRGAHFSNDLYKLWCSHQIEKGKKHYISFHGGGVPLKDLNFEYEYKIANKILIHSKIVKNNQVRLPFLNRIPKINYKKDSKKILLITKPNLSKFITRLKLEPEGVGDYEDYENLMLFSNQINDELKRNISARFLHEDWQLKKRFTQSFKKDQLDIKNNYFSSLKKTKIVITSYLSTPFSEALSAGVPSICILRRGQWVFDEKFKPLIKEMHENNIIFYSPTESADYINKNYHNIYEWWNSKKIVSCVENYKEQAFFNNEKKIEDWIKFIKSEKI